MELWPLSTLRLGIILYLNHVGNFPASLTTTCESCEIFLHLCVLYLLDESTYFLKGLLKAYVISLQEGKMPFRNLYYSLTSKLKNAVHLPFDPHN
jgi:hypothetical protein